MKNLGISSTIEYFITALGNGEPFCDIDSVSLLQLGRGDRNPLSRGQRLRCHGLHAGGSRRFPAPGSRRTLRDSVWMFPEAFAAQREQLWGDCLVRRPQPGLPPRLLEPRRSVCAQGPQGGVSSYTCPRPLSSAVSKERKYFGTNSNTVSRNHYCSHCCQLRIPPVTRALGVVFHLGQA